MSLALVGLGPAVDLSDLTSRAQQVLTSARLIWLDAVTAAGSAERMIALASLVQVPIELAGPLDRVRRARLFELARHQRIALAVAGDPLVATPHRYLVAEARRAGIEVEIVPGVSVATAAASLLGLDAVALDVVTVDPLASIGISHELELALATGRGLLVLGAGKRVMIEEDEWRGLLDTIAERTSREVTLVDLGGPDRVLVVGPRGPSVGPKVRTEEK